MFKYPVIVQSPTYGKPEFFFKQLDFSTWQSTCVDMRAGTRYPLSSCTYSLRKFSGFIRSLYGW